MHFHHTSIKSSLRRGYFVIMLPVIMLVAGGYTLFHMTMYTVDEVMEEVFDELLPFARAQRHVIRLSNSLREYVYQGGERASEKIFAGIKHVDQVIGEISRMRHVSASEGEQMKKIREEWVRFRTFWNTSRKNMRTSGVPDRHQYLEQLKKIDSISVMFESLFRQVLHELYGHRDVIAKKDGQVKMLILIMVSVTIFLSIVIILWLGRKITTPLTRLEQGAEKFGMGDLTHRIELNSEDEFGRLAVVFNRMAADLEHIAGRDVLTGLLNRREFERRYENETNRFRRYRHPMTVIMIDADHFKQVNDRYGHQVGDEVLKQLADLLSSLCRPTDLLARYGGEEFILVLSETALYQAGKMAERIREVVEAYCFEVSGGAKLNVTVSLGLASVPDNVESVDDLVVAADSALYQAKAGGRNRVESYHP